MFRFKSDISCHCIVKNLKLLPVFRAEITVFILERFMLIGGVGATGIMLCF